MSGNAFWCKWDFLMDLRDTSQKGYWPAFKCGELPGDLCWALGPFIPSGKGRFFFNATALLCWVHLRLPNVPPHLYNHPCPPSREPLPTDNGGTVIGLEPLLLPHNGGVLRVGALSQLKLCRANLTICSPPPCLSGRLPGHWLGF